MGLSAPGAPRPLWVLPSAASRLSWRIHCLRTAAFGISMAALTAQAAPKDCGGPKVSEILAVSTSAAPSVRVDCNLRLDPRTVVSKQLIYEGAGASGVTLDCNGATLRGLAGAADGIRLLITSRDLGTSPGAQRWQAPQDISIRNCRIEGSVQVRGMAFNGEDRTLTESSRRAGHTRRVQDSAPRRIVLENLDVRGRDWTPVYFAPGVHHSQLLNSRVSGTSYGPAIYLDAESAGNTIAGNTISTETRARDEWTGAALNRLQRLGSLIGLPLGYLGQTYRESMAIDGSADNLIAGNRFERLDHGGIYLYRNCGEGGNIRHQTPHGNRIIHNVFNFGQAAGAAPAVWLSARNGQRSYCDQDRGYPFGSSASDLDHATGNLIEDNRFIGTDPERAIRDTSGPVGTL